MPENPDRIEISERWWSVTEVARSLTLADGTIRSWCRSGLLPARRIGKKLWRIADSDLQTFLGRVHREADRVRAGSEPTEFVDKLKAAQEQAVRHETEAEPLRLGDYAPPIEGGAL